LLTPRNGLPFRGFFFAVGNRNPKSSSTAQTAVHPSKIPSKERPGLAQPLLFWSYGARYLSKVSSVTACQANTLMTVKTMENKANAAILMTSSRKWGLTIIGFRFRVPLRLPSINLTKPMASPCRGRKKNGLQIWRPKSVFHGESVKPLGGDKLRETILFEPPVHPA